jgi:replicative DNA helicase
MNFEAYRRHILDELEPAKYQRGKYVCPICGSGTGRNRTAALALNTDFTAHCYACNFHGDIFDLVAARDNLDAAAARERVIAKYGGDTGSPARIQRTGNRQPAQLAASATDFTAYIEKAAAALKGSKGADYLAGRGITERTAAAFRLGYDADRQAIVIPYPQENYYITRSLEGKEYRKPAGTQEPLFNAAALQADCVFITEGQLDALSIEEVGGAACAIGGSGSRKLQNVTAAGRVYIFADADEAGEKTAQRIKETLAGNGVNVEKIITTGRDDCKDANDLLRTDRAALEKIVKDAQGAAVDAAKAYEEEAAGQFAFDLFDARARTSSTSTGFPQIDAALGGGIYEGLYVLGAVSSLGKTTLALQIADQIAQGGTDVLFFSLEMQREEMIAKSISRLTYDLCGGNTRNAKTTRGLTDPLRQAQYSSAEWDLAQAAVGRYMEYGARIWIDEGQGNIGTAQIEQRIEEHIEKRGGRKPIVFIDYLQILASPDTRMSDKQATDRNVFNLKRISRKYKLPIFAISSLNRDNYAQGMNMAAFKESGAIEYSSDVLMGLQPQGMKDGTLDRDKSENRQTMNAAKAADTRALEFVILKNRHGAAFATVYMDYVPKFNRFTESSAE